MDAEFLQGIAVTAGDGLRGLAEELADLAEAHVLPHMQVDDTALVLLQRGECGDDFFDVMIDFWLKPSRAFIGEAFEPMVRRLERSNLSGISAPSFIKERMAVGAV